MKSFKVSLPIILFFLSVITSNAQFSFGAGGMYSGELQEAGVIASVNYRFHNFSVSPSYTRLIVNPDEVVGKNLIDLNIHYYTPKIENVGEIYIIGGVNYFTGSLTRNTEIYSNTTNGQDIHEFGLMTWKSKAYYVNCGLGCKLPVSDKSYLSPEITYSIRKYNFLRFGAVFMFGI